MRMVRDRLMVEDQQPALEQYVWLDSLLVPPHHPAPIGENPLRRGVSGWAMAATLIAKVVGVASSLKTTTAEIRYVVHPRVENVAHE